MNLKELQCLANVVALLRYHRLPIGEFIEGRTDRCWLLIPPGFRQRLETLITEGAFDNHKLAGCRESVARYSMEITLHGAKVELDIDCFNPMFGLGVTLVHGIKEVIKNKLTKSKTNPLKVFKGLRKRGITVKEIKIPKKWRRT